MSETACELHGVASAKTLNIFKRRIRKNGISLMIAEGCKSCSLCISYPFNYTILSRLSLE